MTGWLQTLVSALCLGGLYSLLAVGLSLSFGVCRVVNLAHGAMITAGGYWCWWVGVRLGIPMYLSPLLGVPVFYLAGYLLQSGLLNRFAEKGEAPALLVTLGVAVMVENLLLAAFTPDARRISLPLETLSWPLWGARIPLLYLMALAVSLLLLLIFSWFLRGTRTGKAIRAVADLPDAARLCGIPVERMRARAMGLAIATALAAGFLVGAVFPFYPHSGGRHLMIAFGVVVIGGLGSLGGTFAAGLFLALCQVAGGRLMGPGFQDAVGLLGLLLVLGLRPRGLWGSD